MQKSTPSLKKNFILSSFWQILQIISPFITAPYISRVLGPDGIGVYSYTKSIQMYFSLVAVLGTAAYGTREIARSRDDKNKYSQIFWEIETLSIITSSGVIIIWFLLSIFYINEYQIIFLILSMNIFSSMFDISWLYAGLEQFKYIVAKNSIFQILSIILQFIFVRQKSDLNIYIFIMAGTALAGNLSMWISLHRFVRKPDFKCFQLLFHLKETLVYFIPAVATSLYTFLDKFLIGVLTDKAEENGFYEQATQIIGMGKVITFVSINQVVGSRIAYLHKEKNFSEIKERIDYSCRYILCVGMAVAFGIAAISQTFIPWFFGEKFFGTVVLVKMLCPLIVIIGISNLLGTHWYTPAGYRRQSAIFVIFGAILNILFTFMLIPRLNAIGAVIGTFSAEFIIMIFYVIFCSKNLLFGQIFRNGWRNFIAGILMFIIVNFMNYWNISELIRLFIQFFCGGAIYIFSLLLMREPFLSGLMF